MNPELLASSAVVVAGRVNPAIFTSHWLVKKGVLSEDDVASNPEAVYTPSVVHVPTKQFTLTVLEQQVVLAFASPQEPNVPLPSEPLVKIVEELGETPWQASGINFQWRIEVATSVELERILRAAVGSVESPLHRAFKATDARYGAYMSRTLDDGARLKLDIKPTRSPPDPAGVIQEYMLFAFNFHIDALEDDSNQTITKHLKSWVAYREKAAELMALVATEID